MDFRVVRCPRDSYSFMNGAVVSSQNAELKNSNYVLINKSYLLLKIETLEGEFTEKSSIGFNAKQRNWLGVNLNEAVAVKPVRQIAQCINTVVMELDYYGGKSKSSSVVNTEKLFQACREEFLKQGTVFSEGQQLVLQFTRQVDNCPLMEGRIVKIELMETGIKDAELQSMHSYGKLTANSVIKFGKPQKSTLCFEGRYQDTTSHVAIISPDWDFKMIGIGGLDEEFSAIFRRAFATRAFPPEVMEKTGMKHVRGILLYGPPGTGKTLIARQIGKILHAREPKVINGPEILDKYVGQSEANVRALFADAEMEQKKMGINSALHIIILDELDSICRRRGSLSGSTGVNDTVVNQLLSKIDGVDQLNNVLLIGMTNRLDMIDDALLRPGRMEVQMEIGLPDEKGRVEILNIHTSSLQKHDMIETNVNIEELAKKTRNFSGAELEGLVRGATATAMNKLINVKDKIKIDYEDTEKLKVTKEDFQYVLDNDIKPAFGTSEDELSSYIENGIIKWSSDIDVILHNGNTIIRETMECSQQRLFSMLLKGSRGCGKTALAVQIAKDSGFPFVKILSSQKMVGFHESAKCQSIKEVFEDAYKSRLSCIIIDNIENLIDYFNIGGTSFSKLVLRALLESIEKRPPPPHRLLILATTSLSDAVLSSLGVEFSNSVLVPNITESSQIITVIEETGIFKSDQVSLLQKELSGKKVCLGIKQLISHSCNAAYWSTSGSVQHLLALLSTKGNLH